MKRILVLVHNGFEEIEAVTPIDLCRRAEIDVCVCSMTGDFVLHGAHGIDCHADALFEQIDPTAYDMVLLPGGMPNSTSLRDDPRVIDTILDAYRQGKWITAICAAPIALEKAGLLEGRKATSYPGCLVDESACTYLTEPVVCDGKIITSRGPGTAMLFALKIIEVLVSAETAEQIRKGILLS